MKAKFYLKNGEKHVKKLKFFKKNAKLKKKNIEFDERR